MNKQSLAFLHFILTLLSNQAMSTDELLVSQLLTLIKDIRTSIECKDFNAIQSYRNIYLLFKSVSSNAEMDMLL